MFHILTQAHTHITITYVCYTQVYTSIVHVCTGTYGINVW